MRLIKKEIIELPEITYNLHIENNHNYIVEGNIIASNCHLAKGDSLSGIMKKSTEAKYRIGLTGTLDGSHTNEMVIRGALGPVFSATTTKELQDLGYLSDLEITCLVMNYSKETKKLCKGLEYQQEIDFIVNHKKRNNFIINLAKSLKGNTLILYTLVEKHGDPLWELLQAKVTDRKIFYVHGGTDVEDREEVRRVMKEETVILWFGDKSIKVNSDILVPLTNGETKIAFEISENDDILDSWINENI